MTINEGKLFVLNFDKLQGRSLLRVLSGSKTTGEIRRAFYMQPLLSQEITNYTHVYVLSNIAARDDALQLSRVSLDQELV